MFTIDSTSALFDLDCWPLSLLWVKSLNPQTRALQESGVHTEGGIRRSIPKQVRNGGFSGFTTVKCNATFGRFLWSYTNIPLGPSASCGSESKLLLHHLTTMTGKFEGAMWCVHPTHKMIVGQVLYFHKIFTVEEQLTCSLSPEEGIQCGSRRRL